MGIFSCVNTQNTFYIGNALRRRQANPSIIVQLAWMSIVTEASCLHKRLTCFGGYYLSKQRLRKSKIGRTLFLCDWNRQQTKLSHFCRNGDRSLYLKMLRNNPNSSKLAGISQH